MFGDVFGQRADYSTGIMYGSRRKYLSEGKNKQFSPPTALMTKRQKQRTLENKKMDKKILFQSGAQNEQLEIPPKVTKAAKISLFQRSAKNALNINKNKKLIVIEKFSTTDKSCWKMELQAGCKIYVNKETGEVCEECPWLPSANGKPLAVASVAISNQDTINDAGDFGTGHLVYDEGELDAFFDELDELK